MRMLIVMLAVVPMIVFGVAMSKAQGCTMNQEITMSAVVNNKKIFAVATRQVDNNGPRKLRPIADIKWTSDSNGDESMRVVFLNVHRKLGWRDHAAALAQFHKHPVQALVVEAEEGDIICANVC